MTGYAEVIPGKPNRTITSGLLTTRPESPNPMRTNERWLLRLL